MIIFINGASSSGKTSLSRALQEAWRGPLVYWSLDRVISQLPFSYTGDGANASMGFELQQKQIVAGKYGRQLNDLSAHYVSSLSNAGLDVVVDYVLLDDALFRPFRDTLRKHEVLFVGLQCADGVLESRSASRPDRVTGLATAQSASVHFCSSLYDLELDSSDSSPQELADIVLRTVVDGGLTLGFTSDMGSEPFCDVP